MLPIRVTPISNLDDDSLSTIFDHITWQIPATNSDWTTRPLNLIRAVSQVCRRWRGLLLASPLIWGRLIDINGSEDFLPGRMEWMEEVVRRAGSSPLWIYGEVFESEEGSRLFATQSYFGRLLELWDKIEKLSVLIHGDSLPNDIQRRFLSPAPMLKLFDVRLPQADYLFRDALRPGSSTRLFANHAPLLQEIKAGQLTFGADSPWLSSIRNLDPIPRVLPLRDVFLLLQRTPSLASVSIDTTGPFGNWDETISLLSKPNLANLTSIRLFSSPDVGPRVLDYLNPVPISNLSSLCIHMYDGLHSDPYRIYNLPLLKKTLPIYISSYFTSHRLSADRTVLLIRKGSFGFKSCTSSGKLGDVLEIVVTSLTSWHTDQSAIDCLLETLVLASESATLDGNPALFKSVTHLRLDLVKIQPAIFTRLYAMLDVFHGFQQLTINKPLAGQFLWALSSLHRPRSDSRHVLFPELHTLCLETLNDWD